jgi:hypothetical protein
MAVVALPPASGAIAKHGCGTTGKRFALKIGELQTFTAIIQNASGGSAFVSAIMNPEKG